MVHEVVHSMFPTSNPFMPCFQPMGTDSGSTAVVNQSQAAARNPKKRSRASRPVPTTNFRAMMQEFTGIPAPPFNNSSSSFSRSRLDFFGSRSTAFDAAQPPPYLRRPFPQKPFLDTNTNTTPTPSSSMNYQLPMTHLSNLFNIPNQGMLTASPMALLIGVVTASMLLLFIVVIARRWWLRKEMGWAGWERWKSHESWLERRGGDGMEVDVADDMEVERRWRRRVG